MTKNEITKLERIASKDGIRFIDIMRVEDGTFMLYQFIKKYDPEEEQSYEIRELPGPTGRYGDLAAAVLEAKRILNLRD